MSQIQPLFTTGIVKVDLAVMRVVETFEAMAPGCILAYYLDGSLADGDAIATSDLDVTLVTVSRLDDNGQERLDEIAALCQENAGMELDIKLIREKDLTEGLTPMLKLASRLVFGQECRGRFPLLPIDVWARERMNAAYWLMNQVFDRPKTVRYPLDYPDPGDPFGGYTKRTVSGSNDALVPSTRDLVRVSGWIATALIAYRTGHYVARKRDCHREYRMYIGDQWSALLDDIYNRCRSDWEYLIPSDAVDRKYLQAICRRMLGFENHFLSVYRGVLLEQLRERAPRALWLMERLPMDDAAVTAALLGGTSIRTENVESD